VGAAEGSNVGGYYRDPAGIKYYVKFYNSNEQGRSEILANSIYLPKKKKTQESMEPFKPQDGDQLQKPRVLPVEDHNAAPRPTGKVNPRGWGASKKERI